MCCTSSGNLIGFSGKVNLASSHQHFGALIQLPWARCLRLHLRSWIAAAVIGLIGLQRRADCGLAMVLIGGTSVAVATIVH